MIIQTNQFYLNYCILCNTQDQIILLIYICLYNFCVIYFFLHIYIIDSIIDIFNNQLIYNKNKINYVIDKVCL